MALIAALAEIDNGTLINYLFFFGFGLPTNVSFFFSLSLGGKNKKQIFTRPHEDHGQTAYTDK